MPPTKATFTYSKKENNKSVVSSNNQNKGKNANQNNNNNNEAKKKTSTYISALLVEEETTPPWRVADKHAATSEEEEDGGEGELEQAGQQHHKEEKETGKFKKTLQQLARIYYRGSKEDRDFLTESFSGLLTTVIQVPGSWQLNRQVKFGAWLQILGFDCFWDGGYLFVKDKNKVYQNVVEKILNDADGDEEEEEEEEEIGLEGKDELLPPMFVDEDENKQQQQEDEWSKEERHRLELALLEIGLKNWPGVANVVKTKSISQCIRYYEANLLKRKSSIRPASSALAGSTLMSDDTGRRRLRKWQQQKSTDATTTEAFARLSLNDRMSAARRSSAAFRLSLSNRKSSLALPAFHLPTSGRPSLFLKSASTTVISPIVLRNVFEFLEMDFLLTVVASVCKLWNEELVKVMNRSALLSNLNTTSYSKYKTTFAKGKFLSDGAYKQVYKVFNPHKQREEAVSIMNYEQIAKCADVNVVTREVEVALQVSELVSKGWCPNFVETYRVFQLPGDAPWKGEEGVVANGAFQYIHMELCEWGDLESYMKTLPNKQVPASELYATVFQMVFSLFAAEKCLNLKHYDVKCLNFFVSKNNQQGKEMTYQIRQNAQRTFQTDLVMKLADYGTADTTSSETSPIDVRHVTTLENTPIEFFLVENVFVSSKHDVFALGLAMLHVFTGECPYEEILSQVKCPPALINELAVIWETFPTLKYVLKNDDEDVLFHTLYRFVVLLGVELVSPKSSLYHTKAWQCILSILAEGVPTNSKAIKNARKKFAADANEFNLIRGKHKLIAQARARAKQIDAFELLLSMLSFDPIHRPTYEEALLELKAPHEFVIPTTDAVFALPEKVLVNNNFVDEAV